MLIDYTDRPGCTKYASPQLKTLFGHDPAQWVTGGYEYWYAHIHPADRERAVGPWRESCANGTPYFCEYRLMAPDGRFHWVQDMASGASIVVDGERLSYGFMLDVSARRQTEEALREHVHLLKTAQAVAGVGAWSAEPSFEGRVRWSDETCRLFGALPEHFPHTVRAWLDGVHAEDRARVIAAFERLFAEENDGSIELRYRYRRADGVLRWILTHADNVWSSYDDRRLVAGVVRDVTDQIETERRIERLAYHDLLTGLPNRAQLVERLRAALAEARRRGDWIALLYADLDEFKAVNDTLGHAAGDRLLQEVARRIGDARRTGDVVARYGGDEFIVVLSGLASPQEATAMAEQLCARLREPIAIDGQRLQVTTTVGVAVAHGAMELADETLVRQADLALYAAKGAGRNGWRLFSEDLERELQGRRRLESELRRALERGEFVLHYQPQIDLRTGHIVGVEALVRWQHPTRGLVLPGEFIPLAEESRLIVPLGEWVLATALAQLAAWRRAGLPRIRMAVNLSARQFEDVSLPERLRALLHAHAIDPVLLELEVTESCVLRQRELAQDMLERFRALGVSIAIDDFGTGYSNLGALKQYPFARLKIDRLFIRDLTDSDEADALVRAIVAMADALHLPVVAEGVEHAAQLRFLHALGCDEVQGFHTGAPVGAAQIEARFARAAARL